MKSVADQRLNSIHLDDVRRQAFRKAREALLDARGQRTLLADGQREGESSGNRAGIQVAPNRMPAGAGFVLMDREKAHPLKVGLNTVGRLPDNDVVVSDPYVSRRHCVILVHANDLVEVHDVASKNGTFLNGNRLTAPTTIVTGDELRMCDRQYIFMSRTDVQAPSRSSGNSNNDKTQSD
jgi:pSer/pThr/pTyr-binding forkhead associated (FHA) protein